MSILKGSFLKLPNSVANAASSSASEEGTDPSFQITTSGFIQMQDKIDTQKAENAVLRQKLQSKAEALVILTKELEKVRIESDEYRDLVQKLQTQYTTLKTTKVTPQGSITSPSALENLAFFEDGSGTGMSFNSRTFRDKAMATKLADLGKDNKNLLLEREEIKRQLKEREEDVKLLRNQIKRDKSMAASMTKPKLKRNKSQTQLTDPELIRQLEVVQTRYSRLKQDLQVCLLSHLKFSLKAIPRIWYIFL